VKKLTMLALFAGTVALAPVAKAEVLSISGAAFVRQCPCGPGTMPPDVNKGVLVALSQSTLYAAVDFPKNGQEICSLSIVYEDINAKDSMTAKLLRKAFTVGGNPFGNPAVVATVRSAPSVPATIRKATFFPDAPPIDDTTGFYFVEVSIPTNNLNLLGVQIDYRPSCPAP
jgi:hypothetical protein